MKNLLNNLLSTALILVFVSVSAAQFPADKQKDLPFKNPFDKRPDVASPGKQSARVSFTSGFTLETGSRTGKLYLTAKIAPECHIYSLRKTGKAKPSKINVAKNESASVGDFEPDTDPIKKKDEQLGDVEFHEEQVTWTAPIELTQAIEPQTFQFELTYSGVVCKAGECDPIDPTKLVAKFVGFTEPAKREGEFRAERSAVLLKGNASPAHVRPGETLTLTIAAIPDAGWHIYEYGTTVPAEGSKPMLFFITKSSGFSIGKVQAAQKTIHPETNTAGPTLDYYDGEAQFSLDLKVPADTALGKKELRGVFAFQTCQGTNCQVPMAVEFITEIVVDSEGGGEPAFLGFSEMISYDEAAKQAEQYAKSNAVSAGEWGEYPIIAVLGLAFLAGLILNAMPCVLPVIGLKIMAFVHQAGEHPFRIFMLNFVFVLGLMSVFMALATLAVFFGLSWGDPFKSFAFKVSMISIVFVFGLSFLGVWEIPIPGFVGSGAAGKLSDREGYSGAFGKGVLTTLLATPCAGPLLIPAVTWAIAQPAWLTYLTFAALGLGMASPFLIIGAVPRLINALPKPGAWMNTFKQFMGFLMMGTVVFLTNSVGQYITAVLAFVVVLGVACWWFGSTPLTAEFGQKAKAWSVTAIIVVLGIYFSFYVLIPQHELAWQPYSKAIMEEHLAEGRTVFVDFTADW